MPRRILVRVLTAIAILALGWGVAAWLAGGLSFTIAGLRVSSSNYWRPIAAGLAAAVSAALTNGWRASLADLSRMAAGVTPRGAAVAVAIATAILGLVAGSWTASGPDSYAYVSQAAMYRGGRLSLPMDLASEAPWPDAHKTFEPFGYRAIPGPFPKLVPVTAPGLPFLMAGLQTLAGHCAAFLVTPIAGFVLVLATFGIGRRAASPAAGLVAAWLVATSPAVLFMLLWPMSDIPAAAWTAVMTLLLLVKSPKAALAAGLFAAAAVLTRGSLVPVVSAAGLWIGADALLSRADPDRVRRAAWFVLGVLPGVVLTVWLNSRWYGSALASGYGTTGELFSASRIGTNMSRYLSWLVETSPIALLGLPALAWPARRLWPAPDARSIACLLAAILVTATAPYLLYLSYEQWWYLRFLLPAWPALFVAAAVVCDAIRRRGGLAAGIVVAVVLVAGAFGIYRARALGVFEVGAEERRYVTVARLVETSTEPEAVILTGLHAGTLRYYAGRETLRSDVLDPAWLDRAVSWLAERGRHPYILVEDWEHPLFRARFGPANTLGDLSFTPAVAWQASRVRGWVFLYDPLRRDRQTERPGAALERNQPCCARPRESF
jgi:hypothetical protein